MIERIKKRLKRRFAAPETPSSFRGRYEAAERRRLQMLDRLNGLPEPARKHPGYRRALTLLNETFRNARIAQRTAILQSAEWLIDVLETLTLIA
jgi:hypothetical protein